MTDKLSLTLTDLNSALTKNKIEWLLTRMLDSDDQIDDLDVLVRPADFDKAIDYLVARGYRRYSHDRALGGRIKGYQMNLVKNNRIKIDLHKDFTWRKTKYLDLDLIWKSKKRKKIGRKSFFVPSNDVNAFLVFINILFEKAYITENDKSIFKISKLLTKKRFIDQAKKYNWSESMKKYSDWILITNIKNYPIFLPFNLICYSYWEKFRHERRLDLVSFLYYLFFRLRFLVNKRLPYS